MSDFVIRAELLLEQSRFAEAEAAARRALSQDPDNGYARAVLALALISQKKNVEALAEARRGIELAPALGFAHYVLGAVLLDLDEYPQAAKSAREAIRLDTENPAFFWLLSAVQLAHKHWQAALEAADRGLEIDPEHSGCLNVRTTALTHLGRHEEAHRTIQQALYESPEDAYTHLVTGISHMHQGNHARALEHFRETLRIDPTIDAARHGIVECLKARNFIYRWLLAFFLWLSRKGSAVAGGLIIGAFVLVRALTALGESNPSLRPYILPITIFYVVFAFLTWTGDSLFNLLLRLDRDGRRALDKDQIRASNYIGLTVALSIVLIGLGIVLGSGKVLIAGFAIVLIIVPIAAAFRSPKGWPRRFMAFYTLGMIVCGLAAGSSALVADWMGETAAFHKPLRNLSFAMAACFILGAVLSSWIGNLIMSVSPNWSVGRFLRSKRGLALIALVVIVLGVNARAFYGEYQADSAWARFTAERNAAGDPIGIGDIEAARPVIPKDQNGAVALLELEQELATITGGPTNGILIFDTSQQGYGPHDRYPADLVDRSADFVARHSLVLDRLLALRQFQTGRLECDYTDLLSDPKAWQAPSVEAWRTASRLLALETIMCAADREPDGAADAVTTLLRLAAFLDHEPDMLAQLTRCAVEVAACSGLEYMLVAGELPKARLIEIGKLLEERMARATMAPALRLDRARLIEYVQLVADRKLKSNTADGEAVGRPKGRTELRTLQRNIADAYSQWLWAAESFENLQSLARRMGSPADGESSAVDELVEKSMPSISRAIELNFKRLVFLRGARAAIAAELYRMDNQELPRNWTDLVPEYLPEPPSDPFSKDPLILAHDADSVSIRSAGPPPQFDRRSRATATEELEIRVKTPPARGLRTIIGS